MSLPELRPELSAALTARQHDIVRFVRVYIKTHGYPPSVREIAVAVKLASTSSVHHQLRRLEKLGFLERAEYRSRAMRVKGAA